MATPDDIWVPNDAGVNRFVVALEHANKKSINEAFRACKVAGAEYVRQLKRVSPVEFGHLRRSWQMRSEKTPSGFAVVVGTSIKSKGGQPYPVFLEFGTERIAGGKVAQWEEGMAPIMEWPAKLRDLPNFRNEKNVKVYKDVNFTTSRGKRVSFKALSHIERGVGKQYKTERVLSAGSKGEMQYRTQEVRDEAGNRVENKKFTRSVEIARRAYTAGEGEQMPFLRPIGYALRPRIADLMRKAVNVGLKEALGGKKF